MTSSLCAFTVLVLKHGYIQYLKHMRSLFCQQSYNIHHWILKAISYLPDPIMQQQQTNKQMVYGVLKVLEEFLHDTVNSEQHVDIIL